MLKMATAIEGTRTTSGAALLGGFVVSRRSGTTVEALRFDVPRDLRCVLYIPDLRLETERDARGAAEDRRLRRRGLEPRPGRPRGRRDGRSADGPPPLLTVDRLHEPYRAEVYPQLPRLVEAAREAGALGACLSGSGSTVIAFTDTVAAVARIEAAFSAVAADTDLPGQATVASPATPAPRSSTGADSGPLAGPILVEFRRLLAPRATRPRTTPTGPS